MELGPKIVKLAEKARLLPGLPGCYLMKNKKDQVIYVGKAKNLKNRVQTYFNATEKGPKTEVLVGHIEDFEFIITDSDAESFVLENNLIKKFLPKYNIRLKDDKSYPYVVVDKNVPFPRLEYMRKVKRSKGVEVFGPFVTGSNISEVLKILTKSFLLRDCTLVEFKKRKEPCLLFQIEQCSAPCVKLISENDYEVQLVKAVDLFKGNGSKTVKAIELKMHEAAESEAFERAAQLRDDLKKIEEFRGSFLQVNAEIGDEKNIDILAFYKGEIEVDISIYMMRNGLLLGHKNFNFSNLDIDESVNETVMNFLYQYYSQTHDSYPDFIVTPWSDEENSFFETVFRKLDAHLKVQGPKNKFKSLLDLTREHAFESQRVRLLHEDSVYVGLNKLKDLLGLRERPIILECYDIAIFQGSSPTAAQIVFHDGKPDRKNYRHYHLTERPEGNNDFEMMRELIQRRIDNGPLPDVFIVDGGLGQVNVFREVLKNACIEIPVVGIAKSKVVRTKAGFTQEEIKKSEERLVIPGRTNPYFLNNNRALFKIVVQMRDEAHRFSRRLHHKTEEKRIIPGKKK
jgi:excinuclease ABC subunit C